ncbi:peptide/nickel transport system permease protein [Gemmobacter megaterium]|uniref:Peptide/nickel transport system permease protein n=1 Tax=Gemmobacter megaterium TaxID=1086013 RepID=A0A1N7NER8_9RHOB|nr:ABC transporter permease [Gemmobacter megaterium]GGE14691.1 ABC transporter permease [Gemmobacter megaterium]SIS96867.1 peptide/nickel transport system permease protein [Gemmobacter megaterium]
MSTPAATPALPKQNILRIQAAKFIESPTAIVGIVVLLLAALIAVLAPWIAPQNPYDLMQIDIMDNMLPPGGEMMSGQIAWLGTDAQGRDMLSAMLYGLRISLSVGLVTVLIAGAIGATVGVAAAFIGGRFESIVMRIVDLHLAFPSILIALVLLSAFGRGIDKVIIALVIVQWAYYARTVRGSALVETRKDYIAACSVLQLPRWRVLFRHLLPNCIPPLIVVATVQVAGAILLESTLSFLGAGVPVTEPSLGMLISQGYSYMLSGKYWIAVFPGVLLVLVIIAINLVGDRLRIILNPRLSS